MAHDFNQFLKPDLRISALRRYERIEMERKNIPANGINLDFFAQFIRKDVPVISFPVKNQERLFLFKKVPEDYKDRIGLSTPGTAKDTYVLNPLLFPESKGTVFFSPI
ncbi:MAG: hypothetical protein PVH61_00070 [Candidatus Aminicenantes bacterium]